MSGGNNFVLFELIGVSKARATPVIKFPIPNVQVLMKAEQGTPAASAINMGPPKSPHPRLIANVLIKTDVFF